MNMQNQDLVSVIIPTYNRPKIVLRAINSALNQSYKNLEIIVVSDGPSSETKKNILKLENSNVMFFEKEKNEGASACRNFGIKEAKGKWIAFLDDDDYWEKDKLKIQLKKISKYNTENIIVFGKERIVYSKNKKSDIRPTRMPKDQEHFLDYLFSYKNKSNNGIGTSTIVTSKKILNKVKFDTKLKIHEDWQLIIDILDEFNSKIVGVSEIVNNQGEAISGLSVANRKNFYDSKNWYKRNKKKLSKKAKTGLIINLLCSKASNGLYFREIKWILTELKNEGELNIYSLKIILLRWLIRPKLKYILKRRLLN